jgi:hypothetical protein
LKARGLGKHSKDKNKEFQNNHGAKGTLSLLVKGRTQIGEGQTFLEITSSKKG